MAAFRSISALGLQYVQQFTDAYRAGASLGAYEREALCEDVQFPEVLVPPRQEDWLCGKRIYPEVGYSVQYGGLGYYADFSHLDHGNPVDEGNPGVRSEELVQWRDLKAFWDQESSRSKCWNEFDPLVRERLSESFGPNPLTNAGYALYRMSGLQLDYGRLVALGIPGMIALLERRLTATSDSEEGAFFNAGIRAMKRVIRCAEYWIAEAERLNTTANTRAMIVALDGIIDHAPETFHEALQLVMLVQTMSGTINFGRLDTVLGPILQKELRAGTLTWEHSLTLMKNFYTIVEEEIAHYDARIIVGGMGREDEDAADAFALLAMETTDALNLPMPQLSLRFYEGQNPTLLEKAYDVIGRGKTFPMLYNDDVNVSAVEKAFRVDRKTAEQYIPFGCGEYTIYHQSCGTPNFIVNLQMCLELAMNNGRSLISGKAPAPDVGSLAAYESFDELWDAYAKTVDYFLRAGASAQDCIYKVIGRECPYSLITLFYDDCISRAKPIFAGGLKYLGGTNETYGNTNVADSLTAIDQLVFKQRAYRTDELQSALRANWSGFESMREAFKNTPKYGNDLDMADDMVKKVHDHVCLRTSAAAADTDLHHFLVVVINNDHNVRWGKSTGSSADGRFHGEPLAPGNSASAGADKQGLTALLNSQAKPDPTLHAGTVQNVKLSSTLPLKRRDLYHALLRGYFKQGGTQLMVTVTRREDLLAALEHPERYANLLVRVGGFSARFIDLDGATQQEIVSRTEHNG